MNWKEKENNIINNCDYQKKIRLEEVKQEFIDSLWIDSEFIQITVHISDEKNFKINIHFEDEYFEHKTGKQLEEKNKLLIIENLMNVLPKDWIINITDNHVDYMCDDGSGEFSWYVLSVKQTHLTRSLSVSAFNMIHNDIDCNEDLLWIIFNGREKCIYTKEEVKDKVLKGVDKNLISSINIGTYIWENDTDFSLVGGGMKKAFENGEYFFYIPALKRLKSYIKTVCDCSFQKAYENITKNLWLQ